MRVELVEMAVTGGNPLNADPIDEFIVVEVIEAEEVELVDVDV